MLDKIRALSQPIYSGMKLFTFTRWHCLFHDYYTLSKELPIEELPRTTSAQPPCSTRQPGNQQRFQANLLPNNCFLYRIHSIIDDGAESRAAQNDWKLYGGFPRPPPHHRRRGIIMEMHQTPRIFQVLLCDVRSAVAPRTMDKHEVLGTFIVLGCGVGGAGASITIENA